MSTAAGTTVRRAGLGWLGIMGLVVLIGAGIGHRLLLVEIERSVSDVLALRAPLESIPLELPGWIGWQTPIDPQVREIGGFEQEFVNRNYRDDLGRTVSVFVGYQGKPRTVFAHRADICYATHGWNEVSRTPVTARGGDGRELPALLYEFASPRLAGGRMLVLSTYVINGQFSNDSESLVRYNARDPGLLGQRKAYLARVQLAMPAAADRGEDTALLQNLLVRLADPLSAALPYVD